MSRSSPPALAQAQSTRQRSLVGSYNHFNLLSAATLKYSLARPGQSFIRWVLSPGTYSFGGVRTAKCSELSVQSGSRQPVRPYERPPINSAQGSLSVIALSLERMGSKPSKERRRPTPTAIPQDPRIPSEILDEILNHLIADSSSRDDSLRSCSLVSKSWVPSCRRHLFHTIIFSSGNIAKWLKTFPVPQESPAHYVKNLRFPLGGHYGAPEKFSKHTPWFTNVERMTLTMNTTSSSSRTSFPGRLPQSVMSLTIKAGGSGVDLTQMRDIMVHLPNLNDLMLSGPFVARSKSNKRLPGSGTILRGRFGGELQIRNGCDTNEYIVNMLLEVPTGLHFTKIYIYADCPCLLPAVRLAEACCKTLVNLLFSCAIYFGKSSPLPDLLVSLVLISIL